jgi:CBS domain-containing protein
MRIQVKDFMSSPVTTATEKNTIREIRVLMKRQGIHAIPIVRYAKQFPDYKVTIQGIVTATDLNKEIDGNMTAEEVMTPNVHIIHQDSSAKAAAQMMLKRKVHHLVVMDEGKISGMISSLDFVKLVAEYSLG